MNKKIVRLSIIALIGTGLTACGGGSTGPELDQPLVTLTTGIRHSCGLTATGAAFCWGWNRDGQLGDGTTDDQSFPVAVLGGISFTSISAGAGHTCGITADGTAYCWGLNLSGQLGVGSSGDAPNPEPQQVAGGLRFASIDGGGGAYTCGLTADGTAYCWGWNEFGQLGDGTTTDKSAPVPVATAEGFLTLSVGAFHTCGVTQSSTALCWGENNAGQLGIGTQSDDEVPTPQVVTGTQLFTRVTVGFSHTCGLEVSGDVFCWGGNITGQSATGGSGDNTAPTAILSAGLGFLSVTAGAEHTCGVILTGEGLCWGSNSLGQLGHLSVDVCAEGEGVGGVAFGCSLTPTLVDTQLRFTRLALGSHHTCGVSVSDNLAYCWGGGTVGELGNGQSGATYLSVSPQRVAGQVASGT